MAYLVVCLWLMLWLVSDLPGGLLVDYVRGLLVAYLVVCVWLVWWLASC